MTGMATGQRFLATLLTGVLLVKEADKGSKGIKEFEGCLFPSSPAAIKIYVAGVSGPNRLAYMRSGLMPFVDYDVPEDKTLALQGVLGSNVV